MSKHNNKKSIVSPKKVGEGMSVRLLSSMLFLAAVLSIVFSLFELRQTVAHSQSLYELEQDRQVCDEAIG